MERNGLPRCMVSVDLEEWTDARIAGVALRARAEFPRSLERPVERRLEILEARGARATFFVLGRVARRYRSLVRQIADHHEIGSHGESHASVHEIGPARFADEISTSVAYLQDLCGHKVHGFRAPNWSIGGCLSWAIATFRNHGISYDSSIIPGPGVAFLRGERSAEEAPHRISVEPSIWEFPPTTLRLPGISIPAAGGAFMKVLPQRLVLKILARTVAADALPHIHVHPWEFARPDDLPVGPIRGALLFAGCTSVTRKLDAILDRHQGITIEERWRELEGRPDETTRQGTVREEVETAPEPILVS